MLDNSKNRIKTERTPVSTKFTLTAKYTHISVFINCDFFKKYIFLHRVVGKKTRVVRKNAVIYKSRCSENAL